MKESHLAGDTLQYLNTLTYQCYRLGLLYLLVADTYVVCFALQMVWEGLCGDTSNRWADKSLSAILTRNGYGIMNNDVSLTFVFFYCFMKSHALFSF